MSVTIVVWNVETFGDTWNAARGAAYAPLCNFMAQALYTVSTDILILEELRSGGVAYLPTLQAALVTRSGNANDVWNYDYIPGSILANIGYPILNAGNLGFTQQGHSEGYAVLWRDRAEFSVLGTRVALSGHPTGGKSRIGLVIEGRSGNPRNVPNPYWFTAPDFDPNRPPFAWPPLEFPEANPIHQGDTRWTLCRRPCCVVLELNRQNVPREQRLLPIVVHHATNHDFSTQWSVQSQTYSAQLYQVDDTAQPNRTMVTVDQAIAAGDLNIDHNEKTKVEYGAYSYFTKGFAAGNPGEGGANLPYTWVNSQTLARNLSCVRLSHSDGRPITDNNVDDYRWLAIDNLFTRNLTNAPLANWGPVYNVLAGLQTGSFLVDKVSKRAVIRSFRAAIITELGAAQVGGGYANYPRVNPANQTPCKTRKTMNDGTYKYSGPVIGDLLDFNAYLADLNNGSFSSARRAVEFYRNSVSDHLPVVYRFKV
ncbi:MAG TPA: hypothetical protein VMA95_22350 [Streptosporangiaceae bacterium]|nr:hypothetical protein [Streptosporangiaceae bacterium]